MNPSAARTRILFAVANLFVLGVASAADPKHSDMGSILASDELGSGYFQEESELISSPLELPGAVLNESEPAVSQVLFQLDQTSPLQPAPQPFEAPVGLSPAAREFADTILASRRTRTNMLSSQRRRYVRSSSDLIFGSEAKFRVSTDAGNLLGKSNSAQGVKTKQRSPVITETKVHGSNVGQLLASGSYWFPARQDIDTILSKIDSRIIENVIVVKGPFASRYGPGFDFIDFQLREAPRYRDGYEVHGSTSAEYKTNGEQWYGRQDLWGGSDNYGFRIGYGARTGNDYKDGEGNRFLSSYQVQDVDVAFGYDFTPHRHLELSYIWLEMNDVEVPKQLLDINHLATHGVESAYVVEDSDLFDVWTLDTWYNTTKMNGDANNPAKGEAIPFLGQNIRSLVYNAENMSTGFSLFGDVYQADAVTTYGVDMRYLEQEVNQFSEVNGLSFPFLFGNNETAGVNGPVPAAYTANPGLFIERTRDVTDRLKIGSGARVDIVQMNAATIVDEVGGLSGPLGLVGPNGEFPFVYNPDGNPVLFPPPTGVVPGIPVEIDDLLLGSFNQAYGLGSVYVDGEYEIDQAWYASCGLGFGMRAPTMTELYSLQHISTILPQQTFSILFGNPNLKPERRYQINLGLGVDRQWYRARINGFHAWIENYITFDAFDPDFYIYQTTNTDLATLAGFDFYGEVTVTERVTSFLTASYVDGRDRTRTSNPLPNGLDPPGSPPTRSAIAGLESEPLPNISPLEAKLGFLLSDGTPDSRWLLEISARFVDNQDRIATSLGELPTPGFTVLDLRSFLRVTDNLLINAGVENFGDRQYREHLDPAGRILPLNPLAPGTESSLGTVFQPGVNFYLASELIY